MADRDTATGVLGLVQAYVNTVDLQDGPEQLTDLNTLQTWLVARGLMETGQPAEAADLKHAIAVREAIRGMIGANSRPSGRCPLVIAVTTSSGVQSPRPVSLSDVKLGP